MPRHVRALARLVLTGASIHVAVVIAHALLRRDPAAINAFTLLELQRLWPALAGPEAAAWSAAVALAGYALAYRATPSSPFERDDAGLAGTPRPSPYARLLVAGIAVLIAGITLHMIALAAIERFVRVFPPVPDVVHAALPYVDFGVPGELAFGAFLVAISITLVRRQHRTIPAVLTLLGIFYAVRGVFLFLLPIGTPPTAPAPEARFVLWPFPGHAYFPGGHAGMMTLLSLSLRDLRLKRAFFAFTLVFAVGTLLARTHYTADALGGVLLGYGVLAWGRRHGLVRRRERSRLRDLPAWRPEADRVANGTDGWRA